MLRLLSKNFLALIEVNHIDVNGVVTLRGLYAKLYVCVGEKGKVKAQVRILKIQSKLFNIDIFKTFSIDL